MNQRKDVVKALAWLVTLPLSNSFYQFLNNDDRGVNSLITDFDRSIPFLKVFVIPYMLWFFFIAGTLVYLCITDRSMYFKTLIAMNLSIIACNVIYFFYQTTVQRPVLVGDDLLTRLTGLVYGYDQPFNCFPSIHCLTSYLVAMGVKNSKAKNRTAAVGIYGMAALIIVSTQFVKQHVLLDVVSAILLGGAVFSGICKFDRERVAKWVRRQFSLLTTKKKLEI